MGTERGISQDDLLHHAAEHGFSVTKRQLVRWHQGGLLPRPMQRSMGRGKGTRTVYPPGTAEQLVALCQIQARTRSRDRVGFLLWWRGYDVDRALVMRVLLGTAARIDRSLWLPRRSGAAQLVVPHAVMWFPGVVARALGHRRAVDASARLSEAVVRSVSPSDRHALWEELATRSTDFKVADLPDLLANVMGGVLSGPTTRTMLGVTDWDALCALRDEVQVFVAVVTAWSKQMAWLYGAGSFFDVYDRATVKLLNEDLGPKILVAYLLARPRFPEGVRKILESPGPRDPPLIRDLKLVQALRDRVPGADTVLTPHAVRALMRNKEAARRRRRELEFLCARYPEEVAAALRDFLGEPGAPDVAPQKNQP